MAEAKGAKFDLFATTKERYQARTFSGGLISLLSLIVVFVLLYSEFAAYMTVSVENDLVVDLDRDIGMVIQFNMTFPRLPCAYMSIDAIDIAGTFQLDVNSTVFKQRLTKRGKPLSKAEITLLQSEIMEEIETIAVPKNSNGCESCYGAESETNKCCPTCDDVSRSYREKGWTFSSGRNIAQCVNEGYTQTIASQKTEGCNVYGDIFVDKVGGNFHIAPGKSFTATHSHQHDIASFDFDETFDLSHTIHELSYGDPYPGVRNPLDNTSKIVSTAYTDLNEETITTNQYSVTSHYQDVDNQSTNHDSHGLPGVYFIYDLSPIQVNLVEHSQTFAAFFTNVCAIIGGIFTIFRIIDQFVDQGVRSIKKSM